MRREYNASESEEMIDRLQKVLNKGITDLEKRSGRNFDELDSSWIVLHEVLHDLNKLRVEFQLPALDSQFLSDSMLTGLSRDRIPVSNKRTLTQAAFQPGLLSFVTYMLMIETDFHHYTKIALCKFYLRYMQEYLAWQDIQLYQSGAPVSISHCGTAIINLRHMGMLYYPGEYSRKKRDAYNKSNPKPMPTVLGILFLLYTYSSEDRFAEAPSTGELQSLPSDHIISCDSPLLHKNQLIVPQETHTEGSYTAINRVFKEFFVELFADSKFMDTLDQFAGVGNVDLLQRVKKVFLEYVTSIIELTIKKNERISVQAPEFNIAITTAEVGMKNVNEQLKQEFQEQENEYIHLLETMLHNASEVLKFKRIDQSVFHPDYFLEPRNEGNRGRW